MLLSKPTSKIILLYLIAIVFTIFNLTNIKIGGLSDVMPMLDLMIIFYFAVFKNRFEIWFLFLLGIWNDSLNGSALGITSICYILLTRLFLIANNRLLVKENFDHVWRQFILFCIFFVFFKWLLISIFNGGVVSPLNAMVQAFISSLFYVVLHKFFDYLAVQLLEE